MFKNVLHELGGGRTLMALSRDLRKLVDAVKKTGKKGTLNLKLTIEVADRVDWDDAARQVVISDAITVNEPKPSRAPTIFFASNDGKLSRNDPGQLTIDALKQVEKDGKVKAAGD